MLYTVWHTSADYGILFFARIFNQYRVNYVTKFTVTLDIIVIYCVTNVIETT